MTTVLACNAKGQSLTTLTVRNLDSDIKTLLRLRAAQDGISMEEEARRLLSSALLKASAPKPDKLADRIRARFASAGDLSAAPRLPDRVLPELSATKKATTPSKRKA